MHERKSLVLGLCLALAMVLVMIGAGSCTKDSGNEPGGPGGKDPAAGEEPGGGKHEEPALPGSVDEEGDWESRIFIVKEGSLYEVDPQELKPAFLAELPEGYALISGPFCREEGEAVSLVLRDPDHAPWLYTFQKNGPGWVKKPIAGATEWEGWTDGFIPSPDYGELAWWRVRRGEYHDIVELMLTDLEKGESRTLAVFNQEMLYPVGWSPDGSALVMQSELLEVDDYNTYFYWLEIGPSPREIGFIKDHLHEPWLQKTGQRLPFSQDHIVEWLFVACNPYRPGEIWFNELRSENTGLQEGGSTVKLKRIQRQGRGYSDLELPFERGHIWKAAGHPARMQLLLWSNRKPYPTLKYELYLLDLEKNRQSLVASGVEAAGWCFFEAGD